MGAMSAITLPPLDELIDRAYVVSLPMTVRFRGVTTREAMLIEGPQGWGEFAPFLEYEARENASWLAAALEMAYLGPPPFRRDWVPVNATVPAVSPKDVEGVLLRFPGCSTIKIKVAEKGHTISDDVERVKEVRRLQPRARIRVDANGAWTVEEALEAAFLLGPLEYMEQPCATADQLKELRLRLMRHGLYVKVAADESIRRVEDPYFVADNRAADVAVVKVAPLGGVRNVLDIAQYYKDKRLDLTVASALDTGVGMNMGLAAVGALLEEPAAAGLATQRLFVEDITAQRLLKNGKMKVEMLAPERDRLAHLAAPPQRRERWLLRLKEAYEVLTQGAS